MANEDFSKTANNKIYVMKPIELDPRVLAQQIKWSDGSVVCREVGKCGACVQGVALDLLKFETNTFYLAVG